MRRIIEKDTSNKIRWINFIGCIMIILLHSTKYKYFEVSSTCKYFLNFIALYLPEAGVPLFFVMSGFLMYKDVSDSKESLSEQYKRKLKSRVNSLVVPFYIYNIFWMLITILEQSIPFVNRHINSAIRYNYTLSDFLCGIFLFKFNGVAWYIFLLVIYALLFPVFARLSKKVLGWVIATCAVLSCLKYPAGWLVGYIGHYNSLFFYVLGAYIAMYHFERINTKFKQSQICMAGLVFLFTVVALSIIPQEWKVVLMGLRTVEVLCVWICCDCIRQVRIPRFATITFFVYMMHAELQKCVNKLFAILLPNEGDVFAIINTFGGVVITYLAIYVLSVVMNKYFGKLWKVINGGRV